MAIFSSGIGIDVSDHHVRIAWVGHDNIPKGLYELVLPHGLVEDDIVRKPDTLKKLLNKLILKSGLEELSESATLLIPESRVFSTSFVMEKERRREDLITKARKEAQKNIPIPFQDAIVQVLPGLPVTGGVRTTVHVVQKNVIHGLKKVFASERMPLRAIEANSLAIFRLSQTFGFDQVQMNDPAALMMIVDIGHRWTNIILYDKIYTSVFSRSLAVRKLNENNKGEIKELSADDISQICKGIHDTLAYFRDSGSSIKQVLIAGVEGAQKNIAKTCIRNEDKVKINPIGEVIKIPDISANDVHTYGAAIGAAIRSAHLRNYQKNHNFL
ncbi:MAG: hypothetical protein ABH846_02590 [Patescibacteria group bacterium]